jgi:hypothetical protein
LAKGIFDTRKKTLISLLCFKISNLAHALVMKGRVRAHSIIWHIFIVAMTLWELGSLLLGEPLLISCFIKILLFSQMFTFCMMCGCVSGYYKLEKLAGKFYLHILYSVFPHIAVTTVSPDETERARSAY